MKTLTKNQIKKIWKENRDYLLWADGSRITKKELGKFIFTDDGKFLTLSDADFYIEL